MAEAASEAEPLAPILALCGDLLVRATGFRNFASPPVEASPHVVHRALVDARSRLDQLEPVLGQAMDLKQATVMRAVELEQAADDAWDEVADKARKQGLRDQFEGAQERYATWRLKTREPRLEARHARQEADVATACEAKVRMFYRGLDNARQDLHKRISALAFENSLDRLG